MAIAKLFQGLINDAAVKSAGVPTAAIPEDLVINLRKTQRPNTVASYNKAYDILDIQEGDELLDYGAGMGLGAEAGRLRGANVTTFEPLPDKNFKPTYLTPDEVPAESANKVVNMNVLNVLPPELRDQAVLGIGKSLKPGGSAIINVRSKAEVDASKNKIEAQDGWIVGVGSERTFQKGFTQQELQKYVQETLGDNFIVEGVKGLNGPTVKITKLSPVSYNELANTNPFPSTVEDM